MATHGAQGWVPVGLEAQILPASSHPVVVNGYGLAVWRSERGSVQVWEDRCPHRGMRLSFGFVRGDRLTCLYHGWEYETGGQCKRIPAHPDLDPPKTICTKTYDTHTFRGIIFTNLGGAPTPPFAEAVGEAWQPVRSIFVAATIDRVGAYLSSEGNAFGASTTRDEAGCYRLTRSDGAEITVALQPVNGGKTALHVTCRGADAAQGQTLARRAVRMRRELEMN